MIIATSKEDGGIMVQSKVDCLDHRVPLRDVELACEDGRLVRVRGFCPVCGRTEYTTLKNAPLPDFGPSD